MRRRYRPIEPSYQTQILERERAKRGNRCQAVWEEERCAVTLSWNSNGHPNLEFAHVAPTSLIGRGRGGAARAWDIKKHPEAYKLVCRPCHKRMDRLEMRTAEGRWRSGPAEEVPSWVTEEGMEGAEADGRQGSSDGGGERVPGAEG